MKAILLFAILLWLSPSLLQAQVEFTIEGPLPTRQEYFQIFLEEPIQKVNSVMYSDDSSPVEYKLSPDGKSIHLLNYNGSGGVKASVVNADGTAQEISKSKCAIHSLQEL